MRRLFTLFASFAALVAVCSCQKDDPGSDPQPGPQPGPDYYPGTQLEGICINGVTWAPVNCGYDSTHTFGLMYQWGRKYGQCYTGETPSPVMTNTLAATVAEGNLEENKDKFYYDGYAWTSQECTCDDAWFTTYNPCPSGWRVPTLAEMSALIYNYHIDPFPSEEDPKGVYCTGYSTYSSRVPCVFLPAAGDIDSRGETGYRGEMGTYWTSTTASPYTEAAESIYFNDQDVWSGYHYRIQGASVRCVKESSVLEPMKGYYHSVKYDKSLIGYTTDLEMKMYDFMQDFPDPCDDEENMKAAFRDSCSRYDGLVFEGNVYLMHRKNKESEYEVIETYTYGKDTTPEPVVSSVTYPGTTLNAVIIAGTTWAPVNCGYSESHKEGLCYQWGRLYGQPFENITPVYLTKESGQTSAHQNDVGKYNQNDYNWFDSGIDNTLWAQGEKSKYDPCPSGWRVPTKEEYYSLTGNTAATSKLPVTHDGLRGYWFNGSMFRNKFKEGSSTEYSGIFIPISGYRNGEDGSIKLSKTDGRYWSSTPATPSAWSEEYEAWLFYAKDWIAGVSDDKRSDAYNIRCVLNE